MPLIACNMGRVGLDQRGSVERAIHARGWKFRRLQAIAIGVPMVCLAVWQQVVVALKFGATTECCYGKGAVGA
jgi:hypothetical protein